ncbi:MAG: hypothetical protein R2820_05295 [Cyclobacteriaceae bacterium]|nr:hypothetical protein [Cyclobacteriaceae bacterium]
MRVHLTIIALVLSFANAFAQDLKPSFESYARLGEYLGRNGGKWVATNPNYDSTQKYSAYEFEMNFFWDTERLMLWDSVTVRFKGLDYLSWISTWRWHPGMKEVEYTSHGPEGRLISGITRITNDTTFITTDKLFQPDGQFKELKDENFIVSENTHRNISYEKKDGKWEVQGSYVWKRKS